MKNNPHVYFTKTLLHWNAHSNHRAMPWKGEKDPYKIWLSEIILQQTRVEQGRAYYERFISQYPDIKKLAGAKDEEVFKLWEGLGYYNRCKHLLHTARLIALERSGKFPDSYSEIISLKGIGPYTAAAICSFAFNQPYPVVDGNVFRVLSRYFGIEIPMDSNSGKKYFTGLAETLIDKSSPAKYNPAIMDFGATVCKPSNPLCAACPLQTQCRAYAKGLVNHLPVKEKTITKKIRHITWLMIHCADEILISKRNGKDIWENLYEFYFIEKEEKFDWNEASIQEFCKNVFGMLPQKIIRGYTAEQQLTHQKIKAEIIELYFHTVPKTLSELIKVEENKIQNFAFPKILADYLKQRPAKK